MIFPYGHERSVRGMPWVTIAIFGLCVVVFLLTSGPAERQAEKAQRLFGEIADAYLDQPTLELDAETQDLLFRGLGVDDNEREVFIRTLEAAAGSGEARRGTTSQAEFDGMVASFWEVHRSSPMYRFGVVPDRISPPSLVTHQFLHGGWAHLFGNLLFLFLAAPHVEDRWGRALFGGFYLAAGVVAALFWAFRYPQLDVPLVGASGAIAGVMGAFLICFGASKIKFFYWFGIVWGTFEAPAWLMLPLWLVIEVISGRSMDVMAQGQGGGGVAHWAHVWGFIFGAAVAAAVGRLGIDRRIGRVVPEDSAKAAEQRARRAVDIAGDGDVEGAVAQLRQTLDANPDDSAAAYALWTICSQRGRGEEVAPVMLGLIRRAARQRDDETVIARWREFDRRLPGMAVDPVLALHVAETLQRHHHDELVVELLERVEAGQLSGTPPQVLGRLAKLVVDHRASTAADLVAAALAESALPDDLRRDLAALVSPTTEAAATAEGIEPTPVLEPVDVSVELRPAERLRVAEAVPHSLDERALVVALDRGRFRVALSSIQAIAVGAIQAPDHRPFLVVDLLLDSPWDDSGELRVIRLRSTGFDPRNLVGGDHAMVAFNRFLEVIRSRSAAAPLPDGDVLLDPSSRRYASIEDYQHEVLGVTG